MSGMGGKAGDDWTRSEHEVLLRYLDRVRDAVVATTEGLTEERLRAPGVPSGTNLLGLVQHLTGVEEHWFRRVFLGEDIEVANSMQVPPGVGSDEVVAAYRKACARSNEIVRACPDLSTMAKSANPGQDVIAPLRAIVAHMIEETGRHAGHADILRERIDGATASSL
jgi:uncharacterized damage-inducible protein DinB